MTPSSGTLDAVSVFSLLGNQRRLLVIRYLSLFDCETTVTVRHVARVVRGVEIGTPPNHVTTSEYESAYNSLIQNHLPKMDEYGLINYNEQRKSIVVSPVLSQYACLASATEVITWYTQ